MSSDESTEGRLWRVVALWGVAQLGAVAVGGLRVPLSAGYSRAGEDLTLAVLLVVQMGVASVTFPVLLQNRASSAVVVAMAWVYLLLAGFLATATLPAVLLAGGTVTAWLIGLRVWHGAVRSSQGRGWVAAAALSLTLGGAVVAYLSAEYRLGTTETAAGWWSHTPLIGALRQAELGSFRIFPWIVLAVLILTGLAVRLISKKRSGAASLAR